MCIFAPDKESLNRLVALNREFFAERSDQRSSALTSKSRQNEEMRTVASS